MSFLGFFPDLHVPLGGRVDVASCGGGALCTIVPASWAACTTVVDGRLQVLFVGPGGRTCAGWWTTPPLVRLLYFTPEFINERILKVSATSLSGPFI